MLNRKLFKLSYLNLFRNKRRSLSTGLAICVGFVGLNLLGAYIYRVKRALDTTSVYSALRGHIQIYKSDSLVNFAIRPKKFAIEKAELESITAKLSELSNSIEYIGHNLSGSGLLSNGQRSHPVLVYSYEPEVYAKSLTQPELLRWARDWVLPSQLENIEVFKNNKNVVSVTPRIADMMGFKYPLAAAGEVQIAARSFDGDLNAINAELGAEHTTGLQYLEDTIILLPLTKMQELLATDSVESVSIYLQNGIDLSEAKKAIDQKMKELNFKTDSYFYYDEKINAMYIGTMGFLVVMGGFFVFLIGTAVSLTIINSLTMGIIERTKEIGTLRAVGFTRSDVARLFVLENLILGFISVGVGTIVAFLISAFVNYLNIRFTPPAVSAAVQFKLGWNIWIALTVTTLILCLTWISSVIVMRTKSKAKLIELLSDSGA